MEWDCTQQERTNEQNLSVVSNLTCVTYAYKGQGKGPPVRPHRRGPYPTVRPNRSRSHIGKWAQRGQGLVRGKQARDQASPFGPPQPPQDAPGTAHTSTPSCNR